MNDQTTESLLPPGFEALEKYVGKWDHPSTQARWDERASSSMAEIQSFYDDTLPLAGLALAHLDLLSLENLKGEDARLMRLILSLANCAMAVELHQSPRAPHSPFPHGIRVIRGGFPFG